MTDTKLDIAHAAMQADLEDDGEIEIALDDVERVGRFTEIELGVDGADANDERVLAAKRIVAETADVHALPGCRSLFGTGMQRRVRRHTAPLLFRPARLRRGSAS